ncbi:P-loop containing nucleoside triphosphate hydrolase protein [Coprinellus micaceus]|uniref:DNA 3'-5' helicase n=1 Tax=Coprinellus micaceus TaxID=71717 RepID=A0A4Y7RX57_COPMI|nr:P-loop containing nucleoside triphosphate hydrolase protein [Coprinellus micaceus]
MAKEFEEGFGSPARGWQLDVAETTYLDLDCVHKAFILSPLKVLQADQVRSFKEMGIEAAAVNGDTWSLEKACDGGEFHKDYGNLDRLCAVFPTNVPFLVTSATLTPGALREIPNQLGIELDKAFFLNLGNDRPNVAIPTLSSHLRKTIVFVNSVASAQKCARFIKAQLPTHLRPYIDVVHAQRKRRVMKKFKTNDVRVLMVTEATGMGTDIPDIEQVLQLGVPNSLTVWMQRAGRAGRSRDIQARATLLVEPSVFEVKKRPTQGEDEDNPGGLEVGDDGMASEYRKRVEGPLWQWIETRGCRRDIADEYFGCPSWTRKAPTGACCDNCNTELVPEHAVPPPDSPSHSTSAPPSRPQTPEQPISPPASAPGSPNKMASAP